MDAGRGGGEQASAPTSWIKEMNVEEKKTTARINIEH
jgi:hypothetical protein